MKSDLGNCKWLMRKVSKFRGQVAQVTQGSQVAQVRTKASAERKSGCEGKEKPSSEREGNRKSGGVLRSWLSSMFRLSRGPGSYATFWALSSSISMERSSSLSSGVFLCPCDWTACCTATFSTSSSLPEIAMSQGCSVRNQRQSMILRLPISHPWCEVGTDYPGEIKDSTLLRKIGRGNYRAGFAKRKAEKTTAGTKRECRNNGRVNSPTQRKER